MSSTLVTVGTYWDPVEARLARIHLEAAGIRSVLQNEHSVTMNWLEFANASQGVQLQVDAADVDAAMEELERKWSESDEIADEWDTSEEIVSAEEDESLIEMDQSPTDSAKGIDGEKYNSLNDREKRIRRGYLAAIMGLLFVPFEFYSTYELGVSLLSEESIRPSLRKTARNAFLINGGVLLAYFLFAWQCSRYGINPVWGMCQTLLGWE